MRQHVLACPRLTPHHPASHLTTPSRFCKQLETLHKPSPCLSHDRPITPASHVRRRWRTQRPTSCPGLPARTFTRSTPAPLPSEHRLFSAAVQRLAVAGGRWWAQSWVPSRASTVACPAWWALSDQGRRSFRGPGLRVSAIPSAQVGAATGSDESLLEVAVLARCALWLALSPGALGKCTGADACTDSYAT